jgi:ATP-dependent Clp protease, protease subunit
MSGIYQARTGQKADEIAKLMDGESWIGARDAIANGFADSATEVDSETKAEAGQARQITAKRRIDAALAKSGVPRSERRELYHELQAGTQNAPGSSKPRAGDFDVGAALRLLQTLRS